MASQPLNTKSTTHISNEGDDVILTLPNNITVRRYRTTDVQSLARHGSNKRIWDNLRNRMPHPYTEADAAAWASQHQNPDNWTASGPWTPETGSTGPAIPTNYTIAINGEAVGSIGLEFGAESDIYARNAELGYWLSQEHWGKGVMGLVVPAFVDWTWRTFGRLIRLNGTAYEGNLGSRRCLEKAGFVVEGRKKWGFVKNGVLGDEVLLGMLRPGVLDGGP